MIPFQPGAGPGKGPLATLEGAPPRLRSDLGAIEWQHLKVQQCFLRAVNAADGKRSGSA